MPQICGMVLEDVLPPVTTLPEVVDEVAAQVWKQMP
jgi:hypothetical protein